MKFSLSLDKMANLAVIAAAATFIALSLQGYFQWTTPNSSPGQALDQPPSSRGAATESVENLIISSLDQAAIKSSGTPKVALIEFSDFQCPYCGQHARGTYSQIQRDFVDTGQVEYIFFNFPIEEIHPLALHASEAAECAGQQERFWDMRDRLFKTQTALSEDDLLAHARSLGLRLPDFQSCLAGATLSRIRLQMAEAERSGVTSTPTFLIGRIESPRGVRVMYRMRGAQPYSAFARALKDALASGATPTQ